MMKQNAPQVNPSWQGVFVRELIGFAIKVAGKDIIAIGRKLGRRPHAPWRPPGDLTVESVTLPTSAHADFVAPRNGATRPYAILQLHGGAYTIGYLPVFRRRSIQLARLGGQVPVLSLDYRILPDHPYPAALDDAMSAIEWLRQEKGIQPESVIVVGESAGGNLGLALAMRLRDEGCGLLHAMILMSPWTDLACRGRSYLERYPLDPLFGRKKPMPDESHRSDRGRQYANGHDLTEPYLSPVYGEFTGLPPMLIQVGEYEMLYDDAAIVAEKARAAGLAVEFKVWPGMFHAFQMADVLIPEARAAMNEIGIFLRKHLHS